MPQVRKLVYSGNRLEVIEYFEPKKRNHEKTIKRPYTKEQLKKQAEKNRYRSERDLCRVLNCNFISGKDLYVTVTSPGIESEKDAMQQRKRFLDRLRRAYHRKGFFDFKWICVTEKQRAWHHHLILSAGLSAEEIHDVWGHGHIKVELLYNTDHYKWLANYLLKTDKTNKEPRSKGAKSWSGSRNLTRPIIPPLQVIKRLGSLTEVPTPPEVYRPLPTWVVKVSPSGHIYRYFEYEKLPARGVKKEPVSQYRPSQLKLQQRNLINGRGLSQQVQFFRHYWFAQRTWCRDNKKARPLSHAPGNRS